MSKRKEGLRHIKAFEYYVQMEKERTLKQVAEKFGVKLNTVEKWSSHFQWKGRIEEMNRNASLKSQRKLEEQYFGHEKERVRKMKLRLFAILERTILQKQDRLSVAELDRMVRIIKTELGEPCTIASGTCNKEGENPFEGLLLEHYS